MYYNYARFKNRGVFGNAVYALVKSYRLAREYFAGLFLERASEPVAGIQIQIQILALEDRRFN